MKSDKNGHFAKDSTNLFENYFVGCRYTIDQINMALYNPQKRLNWFNFISFLFRICSSCLFAFAVFFFFEKIRMFTL